MSKTRVIQRDKRQNERGSVKQGSYREIRVKTREDQ